MSFPRLVLQGSVSDATITSIKLAYDNASGADMTGLVRDSYTVKRATKNVANSGGTKVLYPGMEYDQFRMVHTWIGHCDVLTESVAYGNSSTTETQTNMALIKTACILDIATGPEYTVKSFSNSEVGPSNPSQDGFFVDAFEQGLTWIYAIDGVSTKTTVRWFIRGIDIQDNQNNTSRVTFRFEIVEPWTKFETYLG